MNIKGIKNAPLALVFAVFFLSALSGPRPSEGAPRDVISVKAEGAARSSAESGELKARAIEDALRNGVKEAASLVIKSEGIEAGPEAEAAIFTNPGSFVLNYKILSEETINEAAPDGGAAPLFIDIQGPVHPEPVVHRIWLEANINAAGLKAALAKSSVAKGAESSVTLLILGVGSWGEYKSLKTSLERIASLKELAYDSFYGDRVILRARITADKKTFMERAAKEAGEGYVVTEGSWQTIIIKAVPEALSGAFER
ncbi:MAG: hypothetical protein HZB83_04135 [Deltaproteobacteria bacterium]|nr:hypothetical protein [Deltaproteobacteria bacterium]